MSKISVSEDPNDPTHSGTWITEDMKKASHSELYLVSLYYIITTVTTVGYGDIYPT